MRSWRPAGHRRHDHRRNCRRRDRHGRADAAGALRGLGAERLSFVIPAWNAISLFLGAVAAAIVARFFPAWSERKMVVLAAGLVVGESLAGVLSIFMAAIR